MVVYCLVLALLHSHSPCASPPPPAYPPSVRCCPHTPLSSAPRPAGAQAAGLLLPRTSSLESLPPSPPHVEVQGSLPRVPGERPLVHSGRTSELQDLEHWSRGDSPTASSGLHIHLVLPLRKPRRRSHEGLVCGPVGVSSVGARTSSPVPAVTLMSHGTCMTRPITPHCGLCG